MKKSAKIHRKALRIVQQDALYDEVRQALYLGHSKNYYDPEAAMFKAFRNNIRLRFGSRISVPRPYRHCVTITEDIRVTETLLELIATKDLPHQASLQKLGRRLIRRNAVDQPIIIAVCGDTECLIDGYRRVWYRNEVGHTTTRAYIVKYNDWSKHSKKSLSGKSSQ